MRLRMVTVAVMLGALALGSTPALAGGSDVPIGTVTSMGKPDLVHKQQRLTEAVSGRPVGEVVYATYREINPAKATDAGNVCPATMATNLDARVFGPVRLRTSHFSASVIVKLQEFVNCEYSSPGSLDPSAAVLGSSGFLGQWVVGQPLTPTKATAVVLTAKQVGADEILTGKATGPAAGYVAVQVRSGAHWRSIATLFLLHGKFSGRVPVSSGQQLRAVRLPEVGWRAGASKTVQIG